MAEEKEKNKEKAKKIRALSPFRTLLNHPSGLLSEFDRVFDNFRAGMRQFFASPFEAIANITMDIEDAGDHYLIKADLPGMDKEDINIEVHNDILTISAEKQEQEEDKGKNYLVKERHYRSFSRSIPLPKGIESDTIKASLEKGVLHINIPKVEKEAKPSRTIEIK
ncbi:MAG: Hsp20/alpha crystallin family protein [Candidatus Helarchaeota archaeon]